MVLKVHQEEWNDNDKLRSNHSCGWRGKYCLHIKFSLYHEFVTGSWGLYVPNQRVLKRTSKGMRW